MIFPKPTAENQQMTLNDLIRKGTDILKDADNFDADFDSRCIAEFVLKPAFANKNFNLKNIPIYGDEHINEEYSERFISFINKRAEGEPLQYLLGEWEFMGLSFKVGKGVLIPRPETEMLVEFAIDFLKGKKAPVVFDLCSGSGCIAISVAKFCPDARVYAVEKSDEAFFYLEENIWLNNAKGVKAIKGDILDKKLLSGISADLLLSNPPYIRTDDIEGLQREVKKEPVMALDGGKDGFDFYRAIASDWLGRIIKGGAFAVECAEDQTEDICRLFSKKASKVQEYKDLSGLPRGVTGII